MAVGAVLVAPLALAPRAGAQVIDPRGVSAAAPNPLTGLNFFVDVRQPSVRQWLHYARKGRTARQTLVGRIAREPKFRWFGRFNRSARTEVRDYIRRARRRGSVPLIATLRHQGKQCGRGYTAGGSREDRRTKRWFRAFAGAIGRARVVVAFEPDSLGTIDCLAPSRRSARVDVLRYGVTQFAKLPNATVYLEAGASDWEPARRTARLLRAIGVRKVRGFMLNVTHYDWTASNIRYGLEVSRRVGGKHFIVSTAFNGRGPVHYRKRRGRRNLRINAYCHPLHRGLGVPPTTLTAHPKVDAYMWVGRPGFSGGSCNGGPLPVGRWWPARALMFARNATTWLGPPGSTRFGWSSGRFSLREVAGDQLR